MTMFQTAALGIVAVVLALQIKTVRPEYAVYLIIAASVVIAVFGITRFHMILETIRLIGTYIHVETVYLGTLLKMVGVAYLAEFTSGICKDAGCSALGMQVEIVGKVSILVISGPVILALLETWKRFEV